MSARPARTLVLTNPDSGSAEDDLVDRVCRVLEEHAGGGIEVRSPADDAEYAEVLASAAGRDVVVVGGDGSVHRLLQEAHDQGLLDRLGPHKRGKSCVYVTNLDHVDHEVLRALIRRAWESPSPLPAG